MAEWTYRCEYVCCGRCKSRCAHGPYWYGYRREDGRLKKKYFGKTDPRPAPAPARAAEVDPKLWLWDLMLRKETASAKVACQVLGTDLASCRDVAFKAYKRAQLQHHPDRGGSVVASQAVNAAWSYLKAWNQW